MVHVPNGGPVTLAGTTWTTVVAAPTGALRHSVVSLLCMNLDNTQRLVSLRRKKGAVTTLLRENVLIGAGLSMQFVEGMIALDATDETLEMKTDASGATEPIVDAAWMEYSA